MAMYIGKHPVFVSHTKEIEQMLYFTADLQHRLHLKSQDSGVKYNCLLRVKAKCSELLLRMYAEDSKIILLDSIDSWWVRNIVRYVHEVILKDQKKAG